MRFIMIFALVLYFICVMSAPVKESKPQAEQNKNEIDELESELKELQKKISKLKEHVMPQKITTKPIFNPSEVPKTASAEPSVAKDTDVHIISIEKVRQQNDDEELELEGKQPHEIKPLAETEPTPTPHKEAIIEEEEKLEMELEKGKLPVKSSHLTKVQRQEGTTAEPTIKSTRAKTQEIHIISIKKLQQQNREEELDLEGKGPLKTTHQPETQPTPAPDKKRIIEEEEKLELDLKKEKLPERTTQPTKLPVQERTTAQLTAEPSAAKNTDVHVISIEKVRQQNHNEELELEGKRPDKIKHPKGTEATPKPDKKAIVEEEEKLELELEKEKLPGRITHPTKVTLQEKTTAQPTAVLKETDVHIISIEKLRQQNDDEELELEGKQPHKIKRPLEKEPTPPSHKKATIKEEEKLELETEKGKLPGRMSHPTKVPTIEKTTVPMSQVKQEATTESLKHTLQTDSKQISSNELEEERLLESKTEPKRKQVKKAQHISDKLQEELTNIQVVQIEKIETRKTSEPKTEAIETTLPPKTHRKTSEPKIEAIETTLPPKTHRQTSEPKIEAIETTLPPKTHRQTTQHGITSVSTAHDKHRVKTTLKQATTPKHEILHTTPRKIEVSKKPPDNIADLEEELEQQLKLNKGKVARVKKSQMDKDLEKDLKEISLH